VDVRFDPFRELTIPEQRQLDKAVARFGDFLEIAVRRVG